LFSIFKKRDRLANVQGTAARKRTQDGERLIGKGEKRRGVQVCHDWGGRSGSDITRERLAKRV